MNIVNKVTVRHLKENKKRTLITLVGTIISVAMVMAVATLGTSFMNMLQRDSIEMHGDWHVMYGGLNEEQIEAVQNEVNTDYLSLLHERGYAVLEGSANRSKPYLYVQQMNEDGFGQMQINLVSGRLPEKSNEVVISEEIAKNGRVQFEIGDELQLEVGERFSESEDFNLNRGDNGSLFVINNETQETLINLENETYTVVGVVESPLWDYFWSAGYSIISFLDQETVAKSSDVFGLVTLDKVRRALFDDANAFAKANGIETVYYNHDLLRYHGFTANDNMQTTIYSLLSIIIVIIMVGSVALIFNAFAISVSERSRYLGMLSSVGATKRQKRNSVYFEGLIIGGISIPIGVLAGVTGIWITLMIINSILSNIGYDNELYVVVSPWSVLIAVMISALTIFISTYIPAKRASKISAIDAIRQTKDVKLTKRAVKTLPIVRKIFGMEAEIALKNLKRNKKRYQVTVFSLMISIILFLSVSYFTLSLTKSLDMSQSGNNYDISIYSSNYNGEMDRLMEQMSLLENVTDSSLNRTSNFHLWVEEQYLPSEILKLVEEYPEMMEEGKYQYYIELVTMEQASFDQYAALVGGNIEQLNDPNERRAILVENIQYEDSEQGKYVEATGIKAEIGDFLSLSEMTFDEEENDYIHQEVSSIEIATLTNQLPLGYFSSWLGNLTMIVSPAVFEEIIAVKEEGEPGYHLFIQTDDPVATQEQLDSMDETASMSIHNTFLSRQADENMMKILSIFIYGFITLITLISIANIFNTISTSIALRKREFAMLKSIGMTPKSFNKMIYFESIFYGLKSTLYGLPISIAIMYYIYYTNQNTFSYAFELPWMNIVIVVFAVFMIVGAAMLYSMSKVKKENIIDALKQENI